MGTSGGIAEQVQRRLAPLLGELEDAHTELVAAHKRAMGEVQAIEAELQRIEEARRLLLDNGKPTKPAKRSLSVKPDTIRRRQGRTHITPEGKERADKVLAWAGERGEGFEFTGAQAAEFLGVAVKASGSILGGMERRGELVARKISGEAARRFSVPGAVPEATA